MNFFQTLTTLDLNGNVIGSHGAKYLADALQYNKVYTFYYLFIIGLQILFEVDTYNTQP